MADIARHVAHDFLGGGGNPIQQVSDKFHLLALTEWVRESSLRLNF